MKQGSRFARGAGIAALVVAVAATSGCADTYVSATPTPVDFKACLISDAAGFSDGGFNERAHYGLLQSQAQFGPRTSSVELDYKHNSTDVTRAAKKLVTRECNLVMAVGGQTAAELVPLANGNPNVRFAALGNGAQVAAGSLVGGNLDLIEFDTRAAYLSAGYLAAAQSKTGLVGVLGLRGDAESVTAIWYFRQGVLQYNLQNEDAVQVIGAVGASPAGWNLIGAGAGPKRIAKHLARLATAGADVILPAGIDGISAAKSAAKLGVLVIGSDTDWSSEDRFADYSNSVLASVLKPVSGSVVDEVNRAMGEITSTPGQPNTITYTASLTSEAKVVWADGVAQKLDRLTTDYLAGKTSVTDE